MKQQVVIIGAGPAGLTAGYELQRYGIRPIILERRPQVGGIARTETYKGFRFDIGGHRFYTKSPIIQQLWQSVLDNQFELRPRLSRIYYNQTFFPYPIKLWPTLRQLGLIESIRILLSYMAARLSPTRTEETFEQWVSNRFGKRLFNTFFKSYTEKVWGIPTNRIRAEWAAQRIKGLSVRTTMQAALFGSQDIKSLIDSFHYPTHGPGMMWEAFQTEIERGGGQVRGGGGGFRGGRGQQVRGRGGRGGRGRGSYRGGRGRGRGAAAEQNYTKDSLDSDLDSYMSKTKESLDQQLDAYMAADEDQ